MNEFHFNLSVKKYNFRLIFLVLLGSFIYENGFAQQHWNREFVSVIFLPRENSIGITVGVYDYLFGPNSEHGFLGHCIFEASADNMKYFRLLEIYTPIQNKSNQTEVYFKYKVSKAIIIFLNNIFHSQGVLIWPARLRQHIEIKVPNNENVASVVFKWELKQEFKHVRYIRIAGNWLVTDQPCQIFSDVIYDLNKPFQNALKSNNPDIITKESEKIVVNVLNDSEAIAIKGADIGSNIKIYSTSGLEVKSVISNNDLVKIKLPVNQIYIVHIGKSRYKVAL